MARRKMMKLGSGSQYIATAIVIAVVIVVAGQFYMSKRPAPKSVAAESAGVDLLRTGWDFMPGARATTDGLHVTYLGRAIVAQDGSLGQANPPLNVYGTRLQAGGKFTLTATIRDLKGSASLRLYTAPPIIQDEFRVESPSFEIIIDRNRVVTAIWDAYKNQDLYTQAPATKSYPLPSQDIKTVTLTYDGNVMRVSVNGKYITSTQTNSLLTGAVWIGASVASPGGSWTLGGLRAVGLNNFAMAVDTREAPAYPKAALGLQSLATQRRSEFTIGAAMALGPAVADAQYANLAFGGDFGQMTTENALKWQYTQPQPEVYDYREADALVALAQKNKLTVHGHTLVFGEANPQWVQTLPTTTVADRARVKQVMIDHITRTVEHFNGRINSWDVVNEPLSDDETTDGLRRHVWYRAMGPQYIETALRAAAKANPGAKLYINEYGVEADGDRWSTLLALVKKLKAQGVPLDGVGFQAHVYEQADEIDPVVLRRHIQALAQLGLSSRISEMDVYSDNGPATQAAQYAAVLGACLAEPSCVSWSTWGITDRYNMWANDSNRLQYGHDFLWDANAQPTAAQLQLRRLIGV